MDTDKIREGLVWGRIRTKGVPRPSPTIAPFLDALKEATADDLQWAHDWISRSRAKDLTWRTKRIAIIEARFRELAGEAS